MSSDLHLLELDTGNFGPAKSFVAQAGWNQVDADWRLMLSYGRGWGLMRNDRLVGTVMALPYGADFGWISMMLVEATEQGHGIGRRLMETALASWDLEGRQAGLDATPAGRPLYLKLGFTDDYAITRLALDPAKRRAPPEGERDTALEVVPLRDHDWPEILGWDEKVFGADRSHVLRNLHLRAPELALVARKSGHLAGYSFGRDGRISMQVGPIVARDTQTAGRLLACAMAAAPGPLRIDIPQGKRAFLELAKGSGFEPERDLTRMWRGKTRHGDASDSFAIAGPELA